MPESNEIMSVEGQLCGIPLAGPESFSQQQLDYLKRALGVDETVLWESQDNVGHQNVTLSESKSNFERIKILIATNSSTTYSLFHEISTDMANFNVIRGKGGTNVWLSWIRFEFTSDTTLSVVATKSFNFGTQTATSWQNPSVQVNSAEDTQSIWKVVGVHRIAGGN